MKIVITESQYKFLKEQKSDFAYDRQSNAIMNAAGIRSNADYKTVNTLTNKTELTNKSNQKQVSNYGFWDKVIDFFLPGTPVKDGRTLLNNFDAIIKRRIDYNKKNKLPLETLTPEERTFREKILKATPNYGYPDIFALSKIIQDINLGKNIQPQEFQKYKNLGTSDYGKIGKQKYSDQQLKQMMSSRDELKKMWLGIDEPNGQTKGYWIKSEFKPKNSTNPNAVYFKPNPIPKLNPQQFDELYNVILKTKLSNGTFPGGNSSILYSTKFKSLNNTKIEEIHGDLGHFKLGAAEENGRKYISIYDEWDLVPPSAQKFGVNVQKYGKTPLIYYRIYRQ